MKMMIWFLELLEATVERNPPAVLENVHELADYGLLELEANGRAKRPVVWYDQIDVDLPLTSSDRRSVSV